MKLDDIKFDWVGRLFKVAVIVIAILLIPTAFAAGADGDTISAMLLVSGLFLLAFYICLVLITKTILYVAKGEKFLKAGFTRKHYALLIAPVLLMLTGAFVFFAVVEPIKNMNDERELEQKYQTASMQIDSLKENFRTCAAPTIEAKFNELQRSCNLRKGKIKNDYDLCVSFTMINSSTSCLYEHDYESIDCSDATMRSSAEMSVREYNLTNDCRTNYQKLRSAEVIIAGYEASH